MLRICLIIVCLLAVQHLYSRETRVRGVEGRSIVAGSITPEEAERRALENAKNEALRRAGIESHIRQTTALSMSQTNEQFYQLFSAFSTIETGGAVTVRNKESKRTIDPSDGQIYIVVTIDATVRRFETQPDPAFKIDVQGLHRSYREGEAVSFSVYPNQDGYLRIFVFTNNHDVAQLFPSDMERNRKLNAREVANFPTIRGIEYAAIRSANERQEHNMLLFVFTKTDIPFFERNITPQTVLAWINNIEPSLREVVVETFLITK